MRIYTWLILQLPCKYLNERRIVIGALVCNDVHYEKSDIQKDFSVGNDEYPIWQIDRADVLGQFLCDAA